MGYEVTASRKRPRNFEELVGQEFVAGTLGSAVRQGQIAHAYLFAGPRGVGKTSVARILARSLNCESSPAPTDKPCGTCASCLEIARGASLDVIEIDGASNTSVNDVREIRDEVLFPPQRGRYKVYIIDEVHMLSTSAFNALLKTIEEPPPYIVFIFATTEVHKVPATIRSRCQQYNFRLIAASEIMRMLRVVAAELGVQAEERALAWIARESTGSLRDAYTLLDQVVSFSGATVTLDAIREKLGVLGIDELNELAGLLAAGTVGPVLEHVDAVLGRGVSIEQLVADLAEYFRNLLFIKSGVTRDTLLGSPAGDFAPEALAKLSAEQLEKGLEILLSLYRAIRFSLDPRFDLELAMSRLARLADLVTPEELREAIAALRGPAAASAPGPASPAASRAGAPPRAAPAAGGARSAWIARAPGAGPQGAGQPGGPPKPAAGEAGVGPTPADIDPRALIGEIAEGFRRDKPALGAALEKAAASVEGRELVLRFAARDRFQGELTLKEREALNARLAELAASRRQPPMSVRVAFNEPKAEAEAADPRVELLRKVFRGEVVKGEDGVQ